MISYWEKVSSVLENRIGPYPREEWEFRIVAIWMNKELDEVRSLFASGTPTV
jgi:hypothetical protein